METKINYEAGANGLEWRETGSIELYDAGVIIRHPDFDGYGFNDREFPGFRVDEADIRRILEVIADLRHIRQAPRALLVDRAVSLYGDDFDQFEQVNVHARVRGPQLLDIKIAAKEGNARVVYEFTYSGAYSIHWATTEAHTDGTDHRNEGEH